MNGIDELISRGVLRVFCCVLNSLRLNPSAQLEVKLHSFVRERLTLDHRMFVTSVTGSFKHRLLSGLLTKHFKPIQKHS